MVYKSFMVNEREGFGGKCSCGFRKGQMLMIKLVKIRGGMAQ